MLPSLRSASLFHIETATRVLGHRADLWLMRRVQCTHRELLVLVCATESDLSQRDIGEELSIHPNVMVSLLDDMEKRGLVRRKRSPANRRQYIVEATSKGRKVIALCKTEKDESRENIFFPLTLAQVAQFRSLALLVIGEGEGLPVIEGVP